jgi:lysophospholipid acyltransferase (LPLAT)-like uncharacterized protein
MLKRLIASSFFQALIGRAIGCYMLLVGWSARWRRINLETAEAVWKGAGPVIACIWHGRFLLVHSTWAVGRGGQPAKMLISQSREGGVVTHASRMVGADVIRGSAAKRAQEKGGFQAMRDMLRHLESGGCMCLTPDGPRGPRMRASMGPVQLAKLSGAPLMPIAWSIRWRIVLDSWDRLILPLPFSTGAIVYGALVHVARDADAAAMEDARAALEAEMNRIAAEADRAAGAPVIDPAPEASAAQAKRAEAAAQP